MLLLKIKTNKKITCIFAYWVTEGFVTKIGPVANTQTCIHTPKGGSTKRKHTRIATQMDFRGRRGCSTKEMMCFRMPFQ